jgi:hypothetical protein
VNDPEEIRNQLDRLATPDPYGGVDGGQLLARGRRGRRRRRILAGSGAAAGVMAAVTVTATLLSGAGAPAPGNETSVAGTTTSPRPTSPGGSGTATSVGPHEVITEAEAVRRCGEQWSRDAGRPIRPVHVLPTGPSESEPQRKVRTGTLLGIYHDNILGFYKCMIPRRGENRPGEHATPRVPDPTLHAPADADDTTLLRACSAGLDFLATAPDSELSYPRPSKPIATDLTGWRIVARSSLPKVGTTFVALSPTADKVAYCDIDVPGAKAESALGSEVRLTSPDGKRTPYSKPHLSEHILETGSQCNAQCTGWLHRESGRLPSKVVRLHVASPHGKSVDVPVKDGYWALVWANGDPQRRLAVNVTAYDAEGKVVRPDPI